MTARLTMYMYYLESKPRPEGLKILKYYEEQRDQIVHPVIMKLCQNIYLDTFLRFLKLQVIKDQDIGH